MKILGIETSCDETAAAVVEDGRRILSSVIHTQVDLHRPYGGVVPEVASRAHVEQIQAVVDRAMSDAGVTWSDLDALAVTYGPGLATSLIVGLSFARGVALDTGLPLYLVNHLEAHLYSPFLAPDAPSLDTALPFVALVVSGGHTLLVRVAAVGSYQIIGESLDDAAGEAFDKGAKLLGLSFPGGPAIDHAAEGGDPNAIRFPRGTGRGSDAVGIKYLFSYSGLKTALRYHLRDYPDALGDPSSIANLAASYQEAIVDSLLQHVRSAVGRGGRLAVGGGVSLNRRLRQRLQEWAGREDVSLFLSPPPLCADNAGMVAGLAFHEAGRLGGAAAELADVEPGLRLDSKEESWAKITV